jgi:hypothetical protein
MANLVYSDLLLHDWQTQTLLCAHCGKTFREGDSIGWWLCAFHQGTWEPDDLRKEHPVYSWTCCGRKHSGDLGCVRADHSVSPQPWSQEDTQIIPSAFAMKAALPGRPGVVKITAAYFAAIRYNVAEREENTPPHLFVEEKEK